MHDTGQTSIHDLSLTSMHGWVMTYGTSRLTPHLQAYSSQLDPRGRPRQHRPPRMGAITVFTAGPAPLLDNSGLWYRSLMHPSSTQGLDRRRGPSYDRRNA